MLKNKVRYILAVAIFLLAASIAHSQQVRLTLINNGSIGVGDSFAVQVELVNLKGDFTPPASLPGARVERNMMTGSASTVIVGNGGSSVSSSKTYVMQLAAVKAGSYSYGPITVGGVKSNTIRYTIDKTAHGNTNSNAGMGTFGMQPSPAPATPSGQNVGKGDTFLKATVSNSTPYEQEAVIYSVKLYTTLTPYDWLPASVPKFDNCTYEKSDDVSRVYTRETINGKVYNTAIIARYIIYPMQAGKITVKGNAFLGSVASGEAMRDPFTGQVIFSNSYQINETPNNIELNVKPLPNATSYEDVNGVGDFKVSAELGSKAFKTNEVAKILVTVSGTGNLGFVSLPDLNKLLPPALKLLKSEAVITKQHVGADVTGKVVFECTVIPQKQGEVEIPSLPFEFFNPSSGKWYKQTTRPLRVVVEQGSQTHVSDNSLQFDSSLQESGSQSKQLDFNISNFAYWLWYIIPLLLLLAVFIAYRKRLSLLADPELMRQKKANRVARRRLKSAYAAMTKHNADSFYDEMLKGMWGYLSDKLGMPTSELTRSNVSAELREAGASEKTTHATINFIDDCEFAKYGSSAGANMKHNYDEACELINSLEKELKTDKGVDVD